MADPRPDEDLPDTRSRILAAAASLVAEGGVAALTTRAVAAAAQVQAPTIYRLFGDKRGLLDAVAEQGFASYVGQKSATDDDADPVLALRVAFEAHISFGLANPAVFAIMHEVAREGAASPAAEAGLVVLRRRVNRIAAAGRLRVPEEQAVFLIQAVGNGAIATLLTMPPDRRDQALVSLATGSVINAIVSDAVGSAPADTGTLAIGLRARIEEAPSLSPGEQMLLRELLDRIAAQAA